MKIAKFAVVFVIAGCFSAKDQYMCRSRQSEAQTNLRALQTSQASYFAEHAKYASSVAELGFTPLTSKYYDIKIDTASASGYSATATGKADSSGDVWTVDQAGAPTVKTDKCHAK